MKRLVAAGLYVFIIFTLFGCSGKITNNKESMLLESNFKLELPNSLEKYRGNFEKSIRPFVKTTAKKGKTLAWESKFGGNPYMPIGYEYPKDLNGTPMKLLAQINFEEVPDIGMFPSKGILQFYISANDDVYGMNFDKPTAQENFRVIYIPEVIKNNSKIVTDFSFINDSAEDYFPVGSESRLSFKIEYGPVACTDFQFDKIFNQSAYKLFDDNEYEQYEDKYSSAGHKMGGYAYFTQSDPRDNSEYSDYKVLLLQIDTDDKAGIMWGDSGVANFFIRPEELKKLDFTKILYNWDCC